MHTKQLNDIIKNFTSDKWEWCLRTNGTYVDCPVVNGTKKNMAVIAENPSYVETEYIKLKVSHGNYDVMKYDPE